MAAPQDAPPPASSSFKQRACFILLGLLLTAALALNITSLSMTAWVEEESAFIRTTFPVALLDTNSSRTFSREDLNPSSSQGYAFYSGMRAGTFQICYTRVDMSSSPAVSKEICRSYRSESNERIVLQTAGNDATAITAAFKMCKSDKSTVQYKDIGLPSESLEAYLNRFCGISGYVTAVLQIGAIVAMLVAWVSWITCDGSTQRWARAKNAIFVGAMLAVATTSLWQFAFVSLGGLSQGKSAYCASAATATTGVALLVATFGPQPASREVSQREPLV